MPPVESRLRANLAYPRTRWQSLLDGETLSSFLSSQTSQGGDGGFLDLSERSLELEAQQTKQTEENQAVLIYPGVSALPKSAVCTASHSLLAYSYISNKNEMLTEELNFMH